MLQPKKTKFRKAIKGRIHGECDKLATTLDFGAVRPEGAWSPSASPRARSRRRAAR